MGVYKNHIFDKSTNARLDSEYGDMPLEQLIINLLSCYRDQLPLRYTEFTNIVVRQKKEANIQLPRKLLVSLYPLVKQYAPFPPKEANKRSYYSDCVKALYMEGEDKGFDWKNKNAVKALIFTIWPITSTPLKQ